MDDNKTSEAEGIMSMPVRVAQILFFINAVIWITLGVISLFRNTQNPAGQSWAMVGNGILMFANAGAMVACGILLAELRRFFLYLAVGLLAVNILLIVADQFGVLGLVTMIIDVILLGLLYLTRRAYSK